MMRAVSFYTPENVVITYQAAGTASRFSARLIDLIIQIIVLASALQLLNLLEKRLNSVGPGLSDLTSGLSIVFAFLVLFAYATFFEMLWGGRTPGKKVMGLRVVRDGGYPINLQASLIRNILLFVDLGIIPLPTPIYLIGLPALISIFLSPTNKRIGDYAAGTIVIQETGSSPLSVSASKHYPPSHSLPFAEYIRNLDRITKQEYRVIRRFTERRHSLDIGIQAGLGEKIARPLLQKLDITAPIYYQMQFAEIIETIEMLYTIERGFL